MSMLSKSFTAAALAAAITVDSISPALADGAASTRNIFIAGAAAVIGIINWNHKKRIKQEEVKEQARRQASYRSWYYRTYGVYPTDEQFRSWYHRTYGVNPS